LGKEACAMAETLGDRIRQARWRYGMSQAELARRIGISSTALNQIESGKTPDPGVSRVIGIARVLGVTTDALLLGRQGEDTAFAPAGVVADSVTPQPPETHDVEPPRQARRQRPRKAAPPAAARG